DPQVTFDTVARRITRLKLFRILSAVRTERMQRGLDPDEPVFKDPNALLRRLVRKGSLTEDALLDPWGGTMQFVRSAAPPVPFLTVAKGWELHAPGPDGIVSTADDVHDAFERVVRSGSPYAKAVDEVTGKHLGNQGIGLSGTGEGGGGSGHYASLRQGATSVGHGRGTAGISTGDAYWVAPTRTDADGRVRLVVPLGDVETTWQVALVGV